MTKSISPQTTIKELLEINKDQVIGALAALNKNFSRLKNPVLRNLFARRVTIADACKIAGCTIPDFMNCMMKIGFTPEETAENEQSGPALEAEINKKCIDYVELDVRPLLAENKDPLKSILSHINNLKENQGLKLVNTFEPVPLINLLSDKGFTCYTVIPEPDLVVTYFSRPEVDLQKIGDGSENNQANNDFDEKLKQFSQDHIKYLDVRDLEMPKPMMLILENSHNLKTGDLLFIYHKKRPVFLIPELEKQGLKYQFKDIEAGNVHMLIYKP